MEEAHFTEELCSSLHCYAEEEITPSDYLLSYAALGAGQVKDKQILKILEKNSPHVLKSFHGGGTSREFISYKDKNCSASLTAGTNY
jgi:hypothetical protein